LIKKHVKPLDSLSSEEKKKGNIIHIENSIHVSNITLIDSLTNTPTAIRWENKDGKWVRISKTSNTPIPTPAFEPRKRIMGPFDTDPEVVNKVTFSPSLKTFPIPKICDHI
jgi:hypothetical protein